MKTYQLPEGSLAAAGLTNPAFAQECAVREPHKCTRMPTPVKQEAATMMAHQWWRKQVDSSEDGVGSGESHEREAPTGHAMRELSLR